MRIAVIGAGIVGVCTAYELAADGHEVTVIDRRGGIAAEASFANAGVIAPAYVAPWSTPGMPWKVLAQLFGRHAAMRWRPGLDPAAWHWLARWLGACRADRHAAHRRSLIALARYSQERLHALTTAQRLAYEHTEGALVLLRTAQDARAYESGLALLEECGLPFRRLSPEEARRAEPALDAATPLHGAVLLPGGEVANCRQFAHLLRDLSEERHGVDFRFASAVTHIGHDARGPTLRVEQLALSTGFGASRAAAPGRGSGELMARRAAAAARYLAPVSDETYDAVVLCGGAGSAALLPGLGLKAPLQPVYGYSVTFQMRSSEHAPRSAVLDERYKVAISRLGDRVRVAGSAEIGGDERRINPAAIETLHKVMHDWFPSATHRARAQSWKGARPMLADGPPLIGASARPGVWLNIGHGSSGWALACGSARLLADQLAGRPPALDMRAFDPARYAG